MNKIELQKELIEFFIDTLDLEDVNPDEIKGGTSLLSEDIGLNSIDLLELSVALEKKYNIKVGNIETAQEVFKDFDSLTEYIIEQQTN